eukprot:7113001-Karenia_brevis.AAC.1
MPHTSPAPTSKKAWSPPSTMFSLVVMGLAARREVELYVVQHYSAEETVISFSAAILACEKGGQWRPV